MRSCWMTPCPCLRGSRVDVRLWISRKWEGDRCDCFSPCYMGVLSASGVLSIEIANEALQKNTFVSCSPENLLSQVNLIMFTAPPPYHFLCFILPWEAQMWLLNVTICFHETSRRLGSFSYQPSHKRQLWPGPPAWCWGSTLYISAHKQMLPPHHDKPWGRPR